MLNEARPKYIVAYEVGFENEIDWQKPVAFNLALIDRIYKDEAGRARFSIGASVVEPVEFVTQNPFEDVIERLGAIR